jgi:hypothetical protein
MSHFGLKSPFLPFLFEQENNDETAQMSDEAAQTGEKWLAGTLRQPIAMPSKVGIEGPERRVASLTGAIRSPFP